MPCHIPSNTRHSPLQKNDLFVVKLNPPYWASDSTCSAPLLGRKRDAGTEWSDERCALIHGPVTGVRMWHTYDENLSVTTTSIIKLIACDLFSYVF